MISIVEVELIHSTIVEVEGGAGGIRDRQALLSAIERPFQTFDGKELYPSVIAKSAALLESILLNHPFIDGNKRTGYAITKMLLRANHYEIIADEQQRYEFITGIAAGKLKYNEIINWLLRNVVRVIGYA